MVEERLVAPETLWWRWCASKAPAAPAVHPRVEINLDRAEAVDAVGRAE
jgi:hypothetical protein